MEFSGKVRVVVYSLRGKLKKEHEVHHDVDRDAVLDFARHVAKKTPSLKSVHVYVPSSHDGVLARGWSFYASRANMAALKGAA